MQSSDRAEFLKVLNGLAAMKGKPLAIEALDLWWASMQAWSLADFKSAAAHLVGSCQFMPTPFDFNQLKKAGEQTPGEAWAAALKLCLDWRNVQPDSRILRAANAVGGLRSIAHANIEDDLPFIEKRFKEAYEELTDVESVRVALPGIAPQIADQRTNSGKLERITGPTITL